MDTSSLLEEFVASAGKVLRAHAAAALEEENGPPGNSLGVVWFGGRVLRIAAFLQRCPTRSGGDLRILHREATSLLLRLEASNLATARALTDQATLTRELAKLCGDLALQIGHGATRAEEEESVIAEALAPRPRERSKTG